jgi:copper chaperone CopZ
MKTDTAQPSSATVDCCAPQRAEPSSAADPSSSSRARLLSGGAVLGAIFASACCWLPLLLIGMGVSTVGVAGFFEAYRPYFLVATAGLLGTGFYFVYFRKPKCAPGEACAVPNPRLQRMNKVSLWLATVLVIAFGAFPSYVGALFGDDGSGMAAATRTPEDVSRTYVIDGMTCEGCAGHIRTAVAALPGVKAVEVSFAEGTATVVFDGDAADDEAVAEAVASVGYAARPRAAESAP